MRTSLEGSRIAVMLIAFQNRLPTDRQAAEQKKNLPFCMLHLQNNDGRDQDLIPFESIEEHMNLETLQDCCSDTYPAVMATELCKN